MLVHSTCGGHYVKQTDTPHKLRAHWSIMQTPRSLAICGCAGPPRSMDTASGMSKHACVEHEPEICGRLWPTLPLTMLIEHGAWEWEAARDARADRMNPQCWGGMAEIPELPNRTKCRKPHPEQVVTQGESLGTSDNSASPVMINGPAGCN